MRKKRSDRERDRLNHKYREKLEPICNADRLETIEQNLEHNLDVLKALEEEYKAAMLSKSNLKEELEAEGYDTIEEKIEAIKKKSLELVQRIQTEVEIETTGDKILNTFMPEDEAIRDVEFKNKITQKK
jgi:uncharacterized membrane protein YgaE (UPF0421/DUF939 family)